MNAAYHDRHKLEIFIQPELVEPFSKLVQIVLGPGTVPNNFKGEVFAVSSASLGCRHCQAHGAYGLRLAGVPVERIKALQDFERSDLFIEADRTALRFARDAGLEQLPLQSFEDRIEEVFLILEIIVEGALTHSRCAGDVLHKSRLVPSGASPSSTVP